jgi:GT2 family glycosyltransferase
MSIPVHPHTTAAPALSAVVAAAVIVRHDSQLEAALDTVARQSYETAHIVVVGGGESVRSVARKRSVGWVPDMHGLMTDLPVEITHVWLVHDDAAPRKDALAALVEGAQRVDASVAGSKLLRADQPGMLESVGGATDAFLVPYSGLDSEEMDQEQYDVVRDVAFVFGASTLIRKDLFKGLGGADPLLAPQAAGIDLSYRAHAAGGRVVVVPSSEVLHSGLCSERTPQWREEAGRFRAMLKVYSPVTLGWTVPLAAVIGLGYALIMTFMGRRRALVDVFMAWGWNFFHLPSTLAGRRRLRRSMVAGDEELFRYQVRGSALLREVSDRFSSKVQWDDRFGDRLAGLVERRRGFWHEPGLYAALAALVFLLIAGRSILADGVPSVGLTLPLPESALATIRSYAGGWNTAALGSPVPLHPSIGATALVQLVLLSNAHIAEIVLSVGAVAVGLVGGVRLLRRLEMGPIARYGGALGLVGGPATRMLAASGDWPGFVAIGLAPWAVEVVIAPWPGGRNARIGYLARATLATGVLALFAPVAVLVPLVALLVRVIVSEDAPWAAVARAVPVTLLAVPLLFPWLYWVSADQILRQGVSGYFDPSLWAVAGFAIALVLGLIFGDRRTVGLIGWGGALAIGGSLLARTTGLGVGREPVVAGYVLAAVGTAIAVGAAIDIPSRFSDVRLARMIGGRAAALSGLIVAAGVLFLIPSGRVGLPEDRFGAQLEFAAARGQEHGADRILIAGAAADLPGESRAANGFSYRLVSGEGAIFPEAWLPTPRVGDDALAEVLERVTAGEELRPGQALALFGVRWVVFTEPNSLEVALESQLDLRQLPGLDYTTFESEVFAPRAIGADGTAWRWDRPDYVGVVGTEGPVYVAENQDDRWGGPGAAAGWANEVVPSDGRIVFAGDRTNRTMALVAAVWLVALLALSIIGSDRKRS